MGVRIRVYVFATIIVGLFCALLVSEVYTAGEEGPLPLVIAMSVIGMSVGVVGAFVLIQTMVRPLETISAIAKHYGKGDFRERFEISGVPEFDAISTSFNDLADNMRKLSRQVREEVSKLQHSSLELKDASDEVVRSTLAIEERASNNATASEEMSVTIENVARNAENAARGATKARKLAEDGSKAVDNTLEQVRKDESQIYNSAVVVSQLAELSTKISVVVRFISDIADETNLLALNAAIEAARAGEHGRGFAVVADEVRKLAEQTVNSTKGISATVEAIQGGATRAKRAMDSVRESITSVSTRADQTAQSLSAIFAANREIENMVLSISTASEEQSTTSVDMAKNIEETAQEAEHLSTCGRSLPEVARRMTEISTRLTHFAEKMAEGHSETVSVTSMTSGSSLRTRTEAYR
ncbi:MAG: methyl-accepting chemotaxis protein [Planctomycetes bacterium]|nr:methyl-accepting chemotaxis protein [Planctomycetota bacterium]